MTGEVEGGSWWETQEPSTETRRPEFPASLLPSCATLGLRLPTRTLESLVRRDPRSSRVPTFHAPKGSLPSCNSGKPPVPLGNRKCR